MAVKPILFSTEMVRAILDGRKTVTRRLIKPQPELKGIFYKFGDCMWSSNVDSVPIMHGHSLYNKAPYHVGDILYVRETWNRSGGIVSEKSFIYRADFEDDRKKRFWKPSIHMPKEAARIWLRVTDVRVERLQDITTQDICNEGVECDYPYVLNGKEMRYAFSQLWDSTIKKSDLDQYGWDANPFVWVIEFERCETPEGE